MTAYNPEHYFDRRALATVLETVLIGSGFSLLDKQGCTEKVYSFDVAQLPGVSICVYTTIEDETVRALGADAIRITAVYKRKDGKEMQLFKAARVFRVGALEDIGERMLIQMRSAFKALRARSRAGLTCHCGAPKFDAKSGNAVCAETCWVKE